MEAVSSMRHAGAINAVRFSSDGNYCMSCSDDKTVSLWNPFKADPTQGGAAMLIKSYAGVHGYGVLDLCISADNSRFASAGGDRAAFLWDVTTGKVVRKVQGHTSRVNAVAMNRDSTVLLTASYDKTVRIWDLRAHGRDPIQTLDSFTDSVTAVACTAQQIVTGCVDGAIRTFDLRAGQMHCDAGGSPITFVSVTDDSRCALASRVGGTVALTDLSSGRVLQTYSGHLHEHYKTESRVLPDAMHVLSGSEDGTLHAWNYVSGETVLRAAAHSKCVSSVACHPKAEHVLTGSLDGTATLWRLRLGS